MTNIELELAILSQGGKVVKTKNEDGSITTSFYPNPPSLVDERDLIYLKPFNELKIEEIKTKEL